MLSCFFWLHLYLFVRFDFGEPVDSDANQAVLTAWRQLVLQFCPPGTLEGTVSACLSMEASRMFQIFKMAGDKENTYACCHLFPYVHVLFIFYDRRHLHRIVLSDICFLSIFCMFMRVICSSSRSQHNSRVRTRHQASQAGMLQTIKDHILCSSMEVSADFSEFIQNRPDVLPPNVLASEFLRCFTEVRTSIFVHMHGTCHVYCFCARFRSV